MTQASLRGASAFASAAAFAVLATGMIVGLIDADSAASVPRASAPVAANVVTFRDAVGKDPMGPDITSVVVSTDADQQLSFRVNISNWPTLTEDMRLRVWLDADDNLKTGLTVEDLRGLDYFVLVDRWELGLGVASLFECNASTCAGGRQVGFSYMNGGSFGLAAADLRIEHRQRVRFAVQASSGWAFDPVKGYDATNVHYDLAPAHGYWTFDMRPLVVTSFTATPTKPRAGSRYALRMGAVRTATGKRALGKVACSVTAGEMSLRPHRKAFVAAAPSASSTFHSGQRQEISKLDLHYHRPSPHQPLEQRNNRLGAVAPMDRSCPSAFAHQTNMR